MRTSEIIFEVTEALEGGYDACALGHGIVTQGDDQDDLKAMVRDAVLCLRREGAAPDHPAAWGPPARFRPVVHSRLNSAITREVAVEHIGACEARTHFSRLLDRVAQGESLTITRHGKPIAKLGPIDDPREEAAQAVARLRQLRREVRGAPLAELMKTVHEGHRW